MVLAVGTIICRIAVLASCSLSPCSVIQLKEREGHEGYRPHLVLVSLTQAPGESSLVPLLFSS